MALPRLQLEDNNGEIKTDGQGEGEKPFKCWLCPKDFNHKGYLERHVKIHTEGKQKRIRRKGVKIKREGDHSEANPDGTDLKSELDLDQKSDDFNGVSGEYLLRISHQTNLIHKILQSMMNAIKEDDLRMIAVVITCLFS